MRQFSCKLPGIYFQVLPLIICVCLILSCIKPEESHPLKFNFFEKEPPTIPILTFDTVFTSIGSVTRRFTVHNPNNNEISTNILLAGGKKSNFSICVDGVFNTDFKNVTIPKKDSVFILVKVNVDPGNVNDPFLLTDSILFQTGSRNQKVKLIAYGQDANYIVADKGSEGLRFKIVAGEHEIVRWTKEKPYVIYGWAAIDSLGKLEIEAGTKIYFHNNSGLWASPYSSLKVDGTIDEPVLFRGDRLEKWYDADYSQWNRIWINEGVNATISNAIVTNAFLGIQVDPFPYETITVTENSLVKIENTIIKNTQTCGLLARFLNVSMTNCVLFNNGASSLRFEGGNYSIKHITVGNYFSAAKPAPERKDPACYVSNVVSSFYGADVGWDVKADFYNCILTGKVETEVYVNKVKEKGLAVSFNTCLVKSKNNSEYFNNFCFINTDPKFKDTEKQDYTLLPNSPVLGQGTPNIEVPFDILGNPRGDKPDLGAYQH
ncbi:MAG: hypothetical protein LBI45_08975 [Bacteroidales bacterium]|jgi:hypothetical protein|nr:hypothetical protein [Bacteroidales bacterium]